MIYHANRDTIIREVGIEDTTVILLMKKHQADGSAKKFSPSQRKDLREGLKPYLESLPRWAITGSPTSSTDDLRIPKIMVRFKIDKNDEHRNEQMAAKYQTGKITKKLRVL